VILGLRLNVVAPQPAVPVRRHGRRQLGPRSVGLVAACALRDAGLLSEPGVESAEGEGRTGEVLGVQAPSRSYVTPHAEVVLYVASLGGGSSPAAA
jgi:hypothetical protein